MKSGRGNQQDGDRRAEEGRGYSDQLSLVHDTVAGIQGKGSDGQATWKCWIKNKTMIYHLRLKLGILGPNRVDFLDLAVIRGSSKRMIRSKCFETFCYE